MRLGLALVLSFALLGAGAPALAQRSDASDTGAEAAADQEARRLFGEATTAIAAGRFAIARDLLRRSIALVPNAGSAFNLAVALRGTGELRAAVATLEALVAGEHGALQGAQRAQVSALLEATRRELGHLRVEVSGAPIVELRIDGALLGEAREGEPFESTIDPGEHLVTASAPHRTPYEERVQVATSGHVAVRAELGATLAGTLVVEAATPESIVEIEGVARGRGTVSRELPPGEYRISIQRGEHVESRPVRVESGGLVRVAFASEAPTPVLESPWLWAGLGLALVGGVVAIAVPLTVVQEAPPISDPIYGVTATLTF